MSDQFKLVFTQESAIATNVLLRQVTLKGRSDTRLQARILREIKNNLFKITHAADGDLPERGKWEAGEIALSEEAFKFLRDAIEKALDTGKPELNGNFAIGVAELLDALDESRDARKSEKIIPIQPAEQAAAK